MSDYLTSDELADLVGCKPNQRSVMSAWLTKNAWPYVVDRNGLPKVMRAYRDKRLGMEADVVEHGLAAGPNLDAFRDERPRRRTKHRT
ncbi:hypothetical protein BCO18175_02328 [Burkholderia contaminans]|uniref:DUF4224 domain-containing protein n=1 Tax=Burkholderia contaminans TaxID=488447 RepID=UPI0014542010|nr:DUF4224 domain-containing protein [Burkholderia contaminans]VWC75466.1 hypothetical protein BCO18175_02328 [Burkholderia contaminans]